jgi:hypothetical protein
MGRPLFSVRFPPGLAHALDRIAEFRGQSRSDVVEMIIKGLDSEDREMVFKTTVADAPTEKLNLRLRADTLTRLTQLAGELEPADFLRRTIAYVVAMAPPEWNQETGAQGNGHEPASERARRRVCADHATMEEGVEVAEPVQAAAAGFVLLAIVLIGALVTLIVWLVSRDTGPPTPRPSDDPRGQLPPDPTQTA